MTSLGCTEEWTNSKIGRLVMRAQAMYRGIWPSRSRRTKTNAKPAGPLWVRIRSEKRPRLRVGLRTKAGTEGGTAIGARRGRPHPAMGSRHHIVSHSQRHREHAGQPEDQEWRREDIRPHGNQGPRAQPDRD